MKKSKFKIKILKGALIHIDSGYFNAGAVLDKNEVCIQAAPIISYMMGWSKTQILSYCKQKNWKTLITG